MGEICDNCAKIFQGEQKFAESKIFIELPNISLRRPENCRICLLIWVRHKRATEGKTVQLLEITYSLFEDKSPGQQPDEYGVLPLQLSLAMKYDDRTKTLIGLAMIAANR
jgi:hypothetical protein